MSSAVQTIQAKDLASRFRVALNICGVSALVRAERGSVGVRISSKRHCRFDETEQRTIIQTATLLDLHHCAPEFGAWPVQPLDRGHPETFTFWSN